MLQFYFLSVLLNVVAGFVLVFSAFTPKARANPLDEDDFYSDIDSGAPSPAEDGDGMRSKASAAFSAFIDEPMFQLVLGSVSVLVALVKFAYSQDGIPVLGDFFTALAGLLGGGCLLLSWLDSRGDYGIELPGFLSAALGEGRRFVGFFCVAAGVLHFILPRVPLI